MIPKLKKNILFLSYIIVILGLFFFSFTQVDLSLTLSRLRQWQEFQKFFQHIGYFNRPLATGWYLSILVLAFFYYILFLYLSKKKKLSQKKIIITILFLCILLVVSYNAFSYDLFNYIFDAKIITHYGQSPYMHKAQDFPNDPMLSFMHWVQRTYPYGPLWLLITVPLSYIGLQYFLPTLILFKLSIAIFFIGTLYYIYQIMRTLSPKRELYSIVFFGLNPLVIIECLVSAHNDIVMMFFAVASYYFLTQKKYLFSLFLLLISIGIKFGTVALLPIYLFVIIRQNQKKKVMWDHIAVISALSMIVPLIVSSIRTEMQPWYFLWILPFFALLPDKKQYTIPPIVFSFGLLLQYVPFFYTGNWDPPIPSIKMYLIAGSLLLSLILFTVFFIRDTHRYSA